MLTRVQRYTRTTIEVIQNNTKQRYSIETTNFNSSTTNSAGYFSSPTDEQMITMQQNHHFSTLHFTKDDDVQKYIHSENRPQKLLILKLKNTGTAADMWHSKQCAVKGYWTINLYPTLTL